MIGISMDYIIYIIEFFYNDFIWNSLSEHDVIFKNTSQNISLSKIYS